MNASTEWWRETLGIEVRRGNRLRNDLNFSPARQRSSLFDISGPDHQVAALERMFSLHGSFKANDSAHCPHRAQKKIHARSIMRSM
ncbi:MULTISPECIES: hypothetical protein [Paraburkholderia]|uniref:hypothetical protein n=1 Tax=Paraburkholderia TaxID=1822464 RepID=UPI0038BD07C1